VAADVAEALGTHALFGHVAVGAADVAALAQQRGAVGVGVLDSVVVEDLAVFLLGTDLTAAHAVGLHRVGVLDPVGDVEVVDVLLGDVVAAQPVEVVPVAHLVLEFGLAVLARVDPDAAVIPVGTHEVDITEGSVMEALHGLQIAGLMMALQADTHLEVLLLGLFGGGEHATDARPIDGHRLFHEHVLALTHGLFEMLRAESRGRRQDDDIGQCDGLLVAIQTHELAVGRDVHLGAL